MWKNEKIVADCLKLYFVDLIRQFIVPNGNGYDRYNYLVDFFIPQYSIIIEYNSHQHYQPVRFGRMSKEKANLAFEKQKIRDVYVKNFCKKNGLTLITIDGRIYTNTKLKDHLNNYIVPWINS